MKKHTSEENALPRCHITHKEIKPGEGYRGDFIKKPLLQLIQKDNPDFNLDSYISSEELNRYREMYLVNIIKQEKGELNKLENEVLKAISQHQILSENIEIGIEEKLTFGQKVADNIAKFGGSWKFILFFFAFILSWVTINIYVLSTNSFDPYPFILLNLILSCIAAIQAPVIMMSQNRLEEKDRVRGEHDYKINLKAELEIRLMNEKIDHLVIHQHKRLLDIQALQLDCLEDILEKLDKSSSSNKTTPG